MKTQNVIISLFGCFLLVIVLASCDGKKAAKTTPNLNSETDVTNTVSDCSTGWTQATDTLKGYQVFPESYALWANSFRFLTDSAELPLTMLVGTDALINSTHFRDYDGLKFYFGIEMVDGAEGSPVQDPVLIVVADSLQWETENGVTNAVYFNDVATAGYYVIERPAEVGGNSLLRPIEAGSASEMVNAWKSYLESKPALGNIYSYTYPKSEINSEIAQSVGGIMQIRVGLKTVSPHDPNYYFCTEGVLPDYEFAGHIVPVVILGDSAREGDSKLLLDFASPCPRFCGQNDL